ncbi:MAG: hypothetical protein RLZZ393_1717, partial [Pseudomonadota bacterium]
MKNTVRMMGFVLALGAACQAAAADQGVALPQPNSGPTTIVLAHDGKVWFTESSGNRIGRMNADGGELVEFALPKPGSGPRILSRGSDGNLWFSEHDGNRIGRITPAGAITEFDIPTPDSHPRAIALGADGNIWFGEFTGNKIGRITPAGVITEFPVPTPDAGPRALAAGPDGNIWFSEYRRNKIGRITPAGVITEYTLPRPNSGPGDITVGADGALWFVELSGGMDGINTDGNRVGRITVDGRISEYAMPAGGPSAVNIAAGPDGAVWYTRGEKLGRVTMQGVVTEQTLAAGARGVGLSAGADREPPARLVNRLYVADGARNRIAWLDFDGLSTPTPAGKPLPAVAPVMACEALASQAIALDDGTPARIESAAKMVVDGNPFCVLKGYVAPQVRFELRLPVEKWQQRLLYTGCGGFCGSVNIRVQAAERCTATDRGEMALVTSDLGHASVGNDTLWAAGNPQGLADYSHRAVHVVTQAAKALAKRYYGQAPRYSYFSGCSDGGREGVVAAMRYPKDFDGIVAGAPVVNVAMNNSLYHAWLVRNLSRRDGSLVFSDADLKRLYDAQLKACPLTAGGVIADPLACKLDLSTVGLTPEQLAAAKALYSGPVDEQGKPLYFGAPPGSELTWNQQVPGSRYFATSFISYVASSPPLKDFDLWTVKFDRKTAAAYTRVSSVIGAVDPDLSAFRKAGGKLILWHGWGDAGVPAGGTVKLYEGLRQRLGAGSGDMLKLYMLPGVYHCGNGPGPDRVDLLSPMMDWVESGLSPSAVKAVSRAGAQAA